jgi:tetratricopeptide (TPR) repeat protein
MHILLFAILLSFDGAPAPPGATQGTAVAPEAQPTIEEQMSEGEDKLGLRRYEDAIAIFNRVLGRIPDFGPALAQRALAHAWTNRLDEATRDIDAAARAMPDNVLLHVVRGTIAQRRSDDPAAIAEYTRALALEPGNRHALRSRAYLYQRGRNHEAALADAESYIATYPHSIEGYVLKADLLVGQRERARATAEADRLMAVSPDDAQFLAAAARIYDALADREHALAAMDRAVAREPGFFGYRLYRAEFRRWDDFAGRRADLEAALALSPDHGDILTRLALLDFKQRRWREAIARFSEVLALEPRDFGLLAYRTMAYLNAGDRALAQRDFHTALAAAEGADDFDLICFSFVREGFALDWAMDTCNRALAINANESAYRANRGLAELRLGRLDAALTDYNVAIEADPRRAGAYYGRALVRHRQGDQAGAAADRREALTIDPAIVETYQSYGFTDF